MPPTPSERYERAKIESEGSFIKKNEYDYFKIELVSSVGATYS